MIKKIYTFGTSFTHGGGFEFGHISKEHSNLYKDIGEELSQKNFSYPGQLQKLLPNIEIIDLSKSGYGNERIYRLASELILSEDFNSDEVLFLIEFSYLGRMEFYSKILKEHFIVNYNSSMGNVEGYAVKYKVSPEEFDESIKKLPSFEYFQNFFNKSYDAKTTIKKMEFNILKFLSFLHKRNVNFLITQHPILNKEISNIINFDEIEEKYMKILKGQMLDLCEIGSITKETHGKYSDGHLGFQANKYIAHSIHDELIHRKIIDGDKFNKSFKDFKKIYTNILWLI